MTPAAVLILVFLLGLFVAFKIFAATVRMMVRLGVVAALIVLAGVAYYHYF